MEKFFKIVGMVVVAWILLSLIGWLVGFVVKSIFWIAIIVGVVYVIFTLTTKARGNGVGRR